MSVTSPCSNKNYNTIYKAHFFISITLLVTLCLVYCVLTVSSIVRDITELACIVVVTCYMLHRDRREGQRQSHVKRETPLLTFNFSCHWIIATHLTLITPHDVILRINA